MIPEVVVLAQVLGIVVVAVGSLSAIGWTMYRKVHELNNQPTLPADARAQLEQLQQSVDAIAVEVERIAEAQRFSAKLLSERTESHT
jgi:cytoskeletal protein RodZ